MRLLLIYENFCWQIIRTTEDGKVYIKVKYNGEVELQRGKKLYEGDTFEADGRVFKIVK